MSVVEWWWARCRWYPAIGVFRPVTPNFDQDVRFGLALNRIDLSQQFDMMSRTMMHQTKCAKQKRAVVWFEIELKQTVIMPQTITHSQHETSHDDTSSSIVSNISIMWADVPLTECCVCGLPTNWHLCYWTGHCSITMLHCALLHIGMHGIMLGILLLPMLVILGML